MPIARDLATKGAFHGCLNQKVTKTLFPDSMLDAWTAALRPWQDETIAVLSALDLDIALGCGERAIFGSVGRELMHEQRKTRDDAV
jgi:hypothetical protein